MELQSVLQDYPKFSSELAGATIPLKILEIERTLNFRIILADINGHVADIQVLGEEKVHHLHLGSVEWNLIKQVVLAIKGRDPKYLLAIKYRVGTIISLPSIEFDYNAIGRTNPRCKSAVLD